MKDVSPTPASAPELTLGATPSPTAAPTTKALPMPTKEAMSTSTSKLQQRWNTKNLGLRLGSDFVSAACAASMVAPVISIIDRYELLRS